MNHILWHFTEKGNYMTPINKLDELAGYEFNGETEQTPGTRSIYSGGIVGVVGFVFLTGSKDRIRIAEKDYKALSEEYKRSENQNPEMDSLVKSIDDYLANKQSVQPSR